ncbi:uncharacterized protein [Paramormyrops kingsleyae]|uniref:uncharacterized protein isoform X2 n=1 Tax=Paramormyrops kingsleyae TaxID=1676925 RepID=UPI000CD65E7E|nr:zinc finger protein with KRAB and SCAN domains 1-like isoform X2 [Paramormyrops kingsleyae]
MFLSVPGASRVTEKREPEALISKMSSMSQQQEELVFFLGNIPVSILVVDEDEEDCRALGQRSTGKKTNKPFEKDRSPQLEEHPTLRSPGESRGASRRTSKGRHEGGAPCRQAVEGNTESPAQATEMNSTERQLRDHRSCPVRDCSSPRADSVLVRCVGKSSVGSLLCDRVTPVVREFKEDQSSTSRCKSEWSVSGLGSMTRRYSCQQCLYVTSRSDSLACHMRIHTGEKPYGCQDCGRAFRTRSELNRHRHPKTLQCDVCEYATNRLDHLKIHRRIHTDERPCVCAKCGLAFRTSSHLTRHKQIHGDKLD